MKKAAWISVLVLAAAALTGCAEADINYKGEQMPISEAQEQIADELEVENPNFDLEVEIYEGFDD